MNININITNTEDDQLKYQSREQQSNKGSMKDFNDYTEEDCHQADNPFRDFFIGCIITLIILFFVFVLSSVDSTSTVFQGESVTEETITEDGDNVDTNMVEHL